MKRALAAAALAILVCATGSPADVPKVPRAKVANAEKLISTQLAAMYPDEPWFLLGPTRGMYLEGFGVVFTAEVNLATGPMQTPFKLEITREEIARHRDKKITRLPGFKAVMARIVGSTAMYLDTLPPSEQLVLGVTLLRYPYEDPKATPSQIIMQVDRASVVEAQKKHAPVDSLIRVVEY